MKKQYYIEVNGQWLPSTYVAAAIIGIKRVTLQKRIEKNPNYEAEINGYKVHIKLFNLEEVKLSINTVI